MTTQPLLFGQPVGKAKRVKPSGDPRIRPFVAKFYEHVGYECLTWGQEAAHAKVLLGGGYTVEQVIACYDYHKSDDFWKGVNVNLGTLRGRIGDWVARGSPLTCDKVAAPKTPREAQRSETRRYYDKWAEKRKAREAAGI